MKAMMKIALVGTSVLSIGALTACQSTNNVQNTDEARMMKHHNDKHHDQKERRLSPEQREQFKAERKQQTALKKEIRQACDNKAVGSTVEVKAGDKAITGTCNISFKADAKDLKSNKDQKAKTGDYRAQGEHRPMRGDMQGRGVNGQNRAEPMTDAQRAELTKQFDQRLAQRQAMQKAFVQACQGKKDKAAAQIKVGEQTINGQCHVRFQPKAPVSSAATISK